MVTTSISVRPRPSAVRLPLVKRLVSLPPAGLVCSAVPRRPRTRCLQGSGVDWVVMGFLGNAFVFSSICSVAKNAEWLFKKDFSPCSTCVAVLVRCSGLHAGSWPGLLEYARNPSQGSYPTTFIRNATKLRSHTQYNFIESFQASCPKRHVIHHMDK